jgi:sulfide:quinone oxidoreductase
MTSSSQTPFRVVIAGGGVAALEGALALRDLAGERISTTLLAPQPEFTYRPMSVREPFGYRETDRYPLDEIARDIGVELKQDAFKWLDSEGRVVHTESGDQLEYDALLLALGAIRRPRFKYAVTLDDGHIDEQLHGLVQDVEGGYVHKLAFISPSRMPWPLPIYELALMTAQRAYEMGTELSITVATPEDAPLAIFGQAVSETVAALLTDRGILMIPSARCETPAPGELSLHPGGRHLFLDRIVALPELSGPSTPGVPKSAPDGFLAVDVHCQVRGVDRVFAAGDATDFPVKHGGLAAQQAETAAQTIAALAGAPVKPTPFHPIIHAVLLGAEKPLYLSAHITGGHGSSSEIGESPTWSPPRKIVAKSRSPYLESRDIESRDRAALR